MKEVNKEDQAHDSQWPLWEVFVQLKSGKPHMHVGSLHATDSEHAIQNARDVYARRENPSSIWVVTSKHISASASEDHDSLFDPTDDKVYRHPQFYKIPKGVNTDVH
ncbi:MAG: 1,2-phenylacetyl-CoA epoxidase subunit B [Candidatus Kapaibacteriales bacterium]